MRRLPLIHLVGAPIVNDEAALPRGKSLGSSLVAMCSMDIISWTTSPDQNNRAVCAELLASRTRIALQIAEHQRRGPLCLVASGHRLSLTAQCIDHICRLRSSVYSAFSQVLYAVAFLTFSGASSMLDSLEDDQTPFQSQARYVDVTRVLGSGCGDTGTTKVPACVRAFHCPSKPSGDLLGCGLVYNYDGALGCWG